MKTEQMESLTLPEEFEGRADVKGWTFRQVKRDGDVAIYRRTRGEDVCHEVVRIRRFQVDKHLNGRFLHSAGTEYYPCPSKWGLDGFSYRTREAAEERFTELREVAAA